MKPFVPRPFYSLLSTIVGPLRCHWRKRRTSEFDPVFYAKFYPDLQALSDGELGKHYGRHGRQEGRFGSARAYLAKLTKSQGSLPSDFDPQTYRWLNADLSGLEEDWEFSAHYLRYGRTESRVYSGDSDSLSAEYRDLLAAEAFAINRSSAIDPPPGTFEDFLIAHRIDRGPWLVQFNAPMFWLLNSDWMKKRPPSSIAAVRRFVEEGVTRLAPISGELAFDPVFYRCNYQTEPGFSDVDLYRHWLRLGSKKGWAPNESEALFRLLGIRTFPVAFDADAYRLTASLEHQRSMRGRVSALRHWLQAGFPTDAPGMMSPDASDLFVAVGSRALKRGEFVAACRAFDHALTIGRPSAALLHGRGDSRMALADKRATDDFLAAIAFADASVWSHVHAIDGLARRGDAAAVVRLLRASSQVWLRNARWRASAQGALKALFDQECQRAQQAYLAGLRFDGDSILQSAMERFVANWPLAEPPAAPLPPLHNGAVVILANLDLPQCVHYRVEQRRRQLEHGGYTVRIFASDDVDGFREAIRTASVAIFYRVPAFSYVIAAILYARALGLRTFYDIDDLIFDARFYPDPIESFEGQITAAEYAGLQFGVPLFRFAMSLCDVGIVSTPALADAVVEIVRERRVHILRNGIDQRNAPFLARSLPQKGGNVPITIFYGSGTRAHNQDFTDLVGQALVAILERHSNVRLVVAGHLALGPDFARVASQVDHIGFIQDVDAYWEILSNADINLAVLLPNAVTDAKSEIKWLEAACSGIPSVVSDTRTYSEILRNGEDALMARTSAEWETALETLVTDPDLRRRIGAAAREKVTQAYSLDAAVRTLATFLPGRPSNSEDVVHLGKPRLLIVNVFFPPQTIGGATRVVRDNLDYLIDNASNQFDFAVVTSDEGVETAGRTRIESYRGVPVLRVSTPLEPNMDWRPFNPEISKIFGEFLDRFNPDIVHFHAVQRLTASIILETRIRNIPYLITLHDGWWISDHQFLIDLTGQAVLPGPDLFAVEAHPVRSPLDATLRRMRLRDQLDGANQLLAVSERFAEIYRNAGFSTVHAVPNGVSRLPQVVRLPNTTGRVRLGHVGGREFHKGVPLIEAALSGTHFENLNLTIVDLAAERGSSRDEMWGTTPVAIIGPVPQAEVADLYGRLDVLLVPSLWPESFGLVAREARAYGLWVIASNLGAVGEDVRQDVDGFIIDVDGPASLRGVIAKIDADSARFLRSPPPEQTPLRTAADQGADLLKLYETTLRGGLMRG